MEPSILLFSPELPCWDEENVEVSGDDPRSLSVLFEKGFLARKGGGYVLTPSGALERQRFSGELCVPVSPMEAFGGSDAEASEALELTRMSVLLDRAFKTQWGIKEVTLRERFPVVPALPDDGYFAVESGRAKAIWTEHPLVRSFMKAFPHAGPLPRGATVPGQVALDAWVKENGAPVGTLTVDFMLRSRADFNHYKNFKEPETDRFHFYNTDPLFAVRCPDDLDDVLPLLGKLHVFLMAQRRVYLPGRFDLDAEDQECWTLLCLVTPTEEALKRTAGQLRRWGKALIDPACPLFIIGTSIERLRAQKEPKDTIYDWFQEETVRILRPDVDDSEDRFV
ncbi:MAG: hypothetical protein ACOYD9_02930 [Pyramidobacter sp.]|jgi:hypothetical protein